MSESSTTTFYLVRHGQTDANALRRFYTRDENFEMRLNAVGKEQARAAAAYFADAGIEIDLLFSSYMTRAIETGTTIANTNNIAQLSKDARINEIDVGDLSGASYDTFEQRYPNIPKYQDFSAAHGESQTQMRARVYHFFLDNYRAYPDTSIVVITHGAIIALILNDFQAISAEFPYTKTGRAPANGDVYKWNFGPEEEQIITFYESGDND